MLLAALIVFTAAGAFIVPPPRLAAAFGRKNEREALIIVDDSPSMERRLDDGRTVFEAALDKAAAMADDFGGAVRVARISGKSADAPFPDYASYGGGNITLALRRELASTEKPPIVMLLTDCAVDSPGPVGQHEVFAVDVAAGASLPDAAIMDIVPDAPVLLAGQACRLNVKIAVFGRLTEGEIVLADEGGDVQFRRRSVAFSGLPGAETVAEIAVAVPPGPEGVTVYRLILSVPGDRYSGNDVHLVAVNRVRPPRVLAVGNRAGVLKTALFPSGAPFADGMSGGVAALDDLAEVLSGGADALVWADTQPFAAKAFGKASEFIAAGGLVIDVHGACSTPAGTESRERMTLHFEKPFRLLAHLLPSETVGFVYAADERESISAVAWGETQRGRGQTVALKRTGKGAWLRCGIDLTALDDEHAAYLPAVMRELLRIGLDLPPPVIAARAGEEAHLLSNGRDGLLYRGREGAARFSGSALMSMSRYPDVVKFTPAGSVEMRGVSISGPESERFPWRYTAERFMKSSGWKGRVVSPDELPTLLARRLAAVPLAGLIGILCLLLLVCDAVIGNMLAAERARVRTAPGRERLAL